jgi:hypothetical protein
MNIVRKYINESKNKKIVISSGLAILCDNKILLAHPTHPIRDHTASQRRHMKDE